jgi:O-antigen ligase
MSFERAIRKGVAALLFLVVLTNWIPGRFCTFAFDAGVFALAALWAVGRTRRGERLAGSIVLAPLAGVVIWGLAQLVEGTTVYRFATWTAVLDWAALAALFFLTLQLYGEPGARAGFRRALLVFGFVVAIESVMQLFSSDGKVFWMFPTAYKEFVVGPFLNRDHYACFIELVLPLAVVEAFLSRRNRMAYAAMAAAMLATVIAGASRAGTIVATLEVALLSLGALWGRTTGTGHRAFSLLRLAALAGVFTAVVGWEVVWQRFQEPDPFKYRREMAASAVEMARARPGMGFGLGTFESAYPAYAQFDLGLRVNHAHNDWVEWAAEGGVPLLAAMAFIALWSVRGAWRSPWAVGIVAVFLHAGVDYPLHRPAILAWLVALAGALAAKENEV